MKKAIEKILKKQTVNLFSEDWYQETVNLILESRKAYYQQPVPNKEFNDKCDLIIPFNERIQKKSFRYNFEETMQTPKKLNLLLKAWAKLNNFQYIEGNSTEGRWFIIKNKF